MEGTSYLVANFPFLLHGFHSQHHCGQSARIYCDLGPKDVKKYQIPWWDTVLYTMLSFSVFAIILQLSLSPRYG